MIKIYRFIFLTPDDVEPVCDNFSFKTFFAFINTPASNRNKEKHIIQPASAVFCLLQCFNQQVKNPFLIDIHFNNASCSVRHTTSFFRYNKSLCITDFAYS